MEIVSNEVISGKTVTMDEKHFVSCKFKDCKLIYSGGDCQWMESTFENCQIVLSGSAQRTAAFLGNFGVLPPSGTNLPGRGQLGFPKKPDGIQ